MENIHQMILLKMNKLGIDSKKYITKNDDASLNFVLINPPNDFALQSGDIVYLLKPSNPIEQLGTSPSNHTSATFNLNETNSESDSEEKAQEYLINRTPSLRTPTISPSLASNRLSQSHLPSNLSGSMKAYLNVDQTEKADFLLTDLTSPIYVSNSSDQSETKNIRL